MDGDYNLLPTRSTRKEFIREYVKTQRKLIGTEWSSDKNEEDEAKAITRLIAEVDNYRGFPGFYWWVTLVSRWRAFSRYQNGSKDWREYLGACVHSSKQTLPREQLISTMPSTQNCASRNTGRGVKRKTEADWNEAGKCGREKWSGRHEKLRHACWLSIY